MRFMMLMIPKGYETAAPGTMPDNMAALDAMMAYNKSLADAGVLVSAEGLPRRAWAPACPSKAARPP